MAVSPSVGCSRTSALLRFGSRETTIFDLDQMSFILSPRWTAISARVQASPA